MKVTALLPEKLIEDVKSLSQGKNLTEALVIALSDWVSVKKLQALNQKVRSAPLQFSPGFGAARVRKLNRRK